MKKIFDFNTKQLPSGIIGYPRNLSWPCRMYRVTLPKLDPDLQEKYNAFELCFLKLLSIGLCEPRTLAEETCFPVDLVGMILLRLYDRELIDKDYHVKPNIAALLKEASGELEQIPAEYETYIIFQELVSGKLLPAIMRTNIAAEEYLNHSNSTDTDGNEDKIGEDWISKNGKPWRLKCLAKTNNISSPKPPEFLIMLRTLARRNKDSMHISTLTQHANFISISTDSESCQLLVRLVIQANSDWRICNPFGKNYSPELEDVYQNILINDQKEAKDFKQWQQNNQKEKTTETEEDSKQSEPYATKENWARYHELISTLSRKKLDVFAALEWAFYYALKQYDIKNLIQLLRHNTENNNQNLLQKAVSSFPHADASSNQLEKRILLPYERKLKSFEDNETAEMFVVLPLAILFSRMNTDFPLNKIMALYPDTLSWILKLKQTRDEQRHGQSQWENIYGKEDYQRMQKIISILLPQIRFNSSIQEQSITREEKFDERFNARLALQDIFGIASFEKMDGMLQEHLLQVEIFRQAKTKKTSTQNKTIASTNTFDALPGINALYAALQCFLRPHLIGEQPTSTSPDYIESKIKKAGWSTLPDSLRYVRPEMLQKTLAGNDQTLGASVLAWILLSDDEYLQGIASHLPQFISTIDQLLAINKHGNQTCMMQGDNFDKLCRDIYKIIRNIEEY